MRNEWKVIYVLFVIRNFRLRKYIARATVLHHLLEIVFSLCCRIRRCFIRNTCMCIEDSKLIGWEPVCSCCTRHKEKWQGKVNKWKVQLTWKTWMLNVPCRALTLMTFPSFVFQLSSRNELHPRRGSWLNDGNARILDLNRVRGIDWNNCLITRLLSITRTF